MLHFCNFRVFIYESIFPACFVKHQSSYLQSLCPNRTLSAEALPPDFSLFGFYVNKQIFLRLMDAKIYFYFVGKLPLLLLFL